MKIQKRQISLVVGEFKNSKLTQSTLSAINAASKIDKELDLIVPLAAKSAVKVPAAINAVFAAVGDKFKKPISADVSLAVKEQFGKKEYSHVVMAHSTLGKDVAPRLSGQLKIPQISDIMVVKSPQAFVRSVYAGNALMEVECKSKKMIVTVRPTSFEPVAADKEAQAEEVTVPEQKHSKWISEELIKSDRPELNAATVVIAGGRGLKSGDNFKLLYDMADAIGGAAVGASRAAVDAGYVPNDLQIGQTGKLVAPKLYFAVGISGAIQHLAGMKDSKVIVAINKDADAPIFSVADYGLVADLFTAIPELTQKVKK